MANCTVKLPEELLSKMSKLGSQSDVIAEKVLKVGSDIVVSKVKSNLSEVIGKGIKYDERSTGELERSLGVTPVKVDKKEITMLKLVFPNLVQTVKATQKLLQLSNMGNRDNHQSLL